MGGDKNGIDIEKVRDILETTVTGVLDKARNSIGNPDEATWTVSKLRREIESDLLSVSAKYDWPADVNRAMRYTGNLCGEGNGNEVTPRRIARYRKNMQRVSTRPILTGWYEREKAHEKRMAANATLDDRMDPNQQL